MHLTPNTVELIPALGDLFPRGGPVQDPVLTNVVSGRFACGLVLVALPDRRCLQLYTIFVHDFPS